MLERNAANGDLGCAWKRNAILDPFEHGMGRRGKLRRKFLRNRRKQRRFSRRRELPLGDSFFRKHLNDQMRVIHLHDRIMRYRSIKW